MSHRRSPALPSPRLHTLAAFVALAFPSAAVLAQTTDSAQQLREVVVSASGFEQEIKNAPASITVLSQEELQGKRFSGIAEALEDVEGIDVRSGTGKTGGLNISIRGMPSDYTLILIDGVRQNAAGDIAPNGFGEFSTSFLPPVSAIERIEVIRGPMATLYGSDAMGGVVNIITKKVADRWSGAVTLDHTFQEDSDWGHTSNGSVYASGPLSPGLLGLALRGNYAHRAASDLDPTGDVGPNTTLNTRGQNPVRSEKHSIGARLTLTPTRDHDLWLDVEQSRQLYDNGNPSNRKLSNNETPTNWRGYADDLEFERDKYVLGHTGRLGFGLLESTLAYSNTETIGRTIPGNPQAPTATGIPGKLVGDDRELETSNLIFDTKLVMPLGEHHITTVGGQWWRAKMTDGIATEDFDQTQWALFVEDEWSLRHDLKLTLGGRYDDHDAFGGHFSPRGYLVWNTNDYWTLKGGVSRGYKTPQLNQLHSGITGVTAQGATATVGNPDLDPETSTTFELSAGFDNQAGTALNATVFLNKFKDKIESTNALNNCNYTPDGGVTYPHAGEPGCYNLPGFNTQESVSWSTNIDKAETKGLELSARVPVADAVGLRLNYTYLESEIQSGANKGGQLMNTPKHTFNARLTWKATQQLDVWSSAEYRSKRKRFTGNYDNLSAANRAIYEQVGDLKSYTLFNLGAAYKASKTVTLNATLYNLLDKDFRKFKHYTTNTGADGWASEYSHFTNSTAGGILEGRRLWVSANIQF